MPTTQTRDTLSALIERSGLLDAAKLVVYRRPGDGPEDSLELARALVRDRLLTPFQARQLLRGRYRGYFLTEKYKVLDQIGEGGMGRVLLCEHLLLQKLVAVKMLHASWVSVPGAEERFLREARAAAAVDHPNIVRVHDVDRIAGAPFMVMEYVDGTNLHQLVAENGPLSPLQAAEFTRQAAVGLGAAHAAGLVHRDIKPGNLLLNRAGVVKLLDLGLARFLADTGRNANLTAKFDAGNVLGTLDFIAPEQADNSSKADIRADIYSLGYSLYYLLTGRLPFGDASAAQKLLWHQMKHPEPISIIRPDLPSDLQQVFERMTQKNPADRYQTPAAVVAALEPLVTAPVPPPPAAQMPKYRASLFLMGLAPQPSREVLAANSAPLDPPATTATPETARTGRRQDPTDSSVLHSTYEPDATDPLGPLPTPGSTPMTAARGWCRRRVVTLAAAGVAIALVAVVAWQLSNPRDITQNPPDGTPPNPNPAPDGVTGAGSSFIDPLMQGWVGAYRQKTGTQLKYTRNNASFGTRDFLNRKVAFACSETPLIDLQLKEAEATDGPVAQLPLGVGAVAVAYNLPEVKPRLQFSGKVLAGIYLGRITRWNDPALADDNPDVSLPDLPIAAVRRADSSGTTFVWTSYLSAVSDDWKKSPGAAKVFNPWPVAGPSAEGNDGVAREIAKTLGAIGYVEPNAARAQQLPLALVKNRAGAFVPPEPAGVRVAAEGLASRVLAPSPRPPIDAPGATAYPVAAVTWILVYRKQLAADADLRAFLRWAVHDGQEHVEPLGYARLPPAFVAAIDAVVDAAGKP